MKTYYEEYLGPWLGKTMKLIDCRLEELLEQNEIDLSKMQFLILKTVAHQEGISQSELAIFASRDKSSLTRMINTLEKKAYVTRIPMEEDKRVNGIYITPKGRETLLLASPLLNDFALKVEEGLTAEEVKSTIEILKRIQQNVLNQSSKEHLCH